MNTVKRLLLCHLLMPILVVLGPVANGQDDKKFDVFERPGNARAIHPNEKLCFDFQVLFKGVFNGQPSTGCFMINVRVGAVLSFGFDQRVRSACQHDLKSKDFQAYLYTLGGNTYSYYNQEEVNSRTKVITLKHYVRTGNTEPESPENMYNGKKFYNKEEWKEYGGGLFKGRKYVNEDGQMAIYVVDDGYLPEIIEPLQFLGAYGIGYLHTSLGTFQVLGYEQDKTECELVDLKKVAGDVCFFPIDFRKEERTRVVEQLVEVDELSDDIEKSIAKAKVSSSSCAALKLKLLAEQKRQNEQREEQLQYVKSNKMDYKKQSDLQKVYSKYDPFAIYLLIRLEAEYNICQIEEVLSKNPRNMNEVAQLTKRKTCLKQKVTKLKAIEEKITSSKQTYRNQDSAWKEDQKNSLMAMMAVLKEYSCR